MTAPLYPIPLYPISGGAVAEELAIEAEMDRVAQPVAIPDPLARPVLPPDHGQEPVPDYSPEQLQELLRLLHPLMIWDNAKNQWKRVDTALLALRQKRGDWLSDQQDEVDRRWRESGAYQREMQRRAYAAQAEAAERREDQLHDQHREQAHDRRVNELIDFGLSVRQAQEQAAREFPDA